MVGYYGAQNLDLGELEWSAIASYGLVGLVTGPVYGAVGALLRDRPTRHRPAVVGLVVAPLLIDGVNLLWEMAHDWRMSHSHQVAYRTAVGSPYFAVGVVLVCWLSRSRFDALSAAAVGSGADGGRDAFRDRPHSLIAQARAHASSSSNAAAAMRSPVSWPSVNQS